MINIAFSDSLSGSLKMADYYAKQDNSEIQDLKENLHSIYMNLSMGRISFDEIGKERRREFANLYGGGSETTYRGKWFDKTIKVVSSLEKLAKSGEEIRIWYSEYPDELCAFCWMLCLLDSWGIDNEKIFYVKLPNSILFNNGDYKTYFSSGAFDPEELVQLVFSQRKLSRVYKESHIKQWKKAKKENTRLRTVIMGEIVSVYDDFYDSVIKIEAQKLEDVFKEAELIGNSLCKLCVSDSFVAWRIDEMIENGLFEIVEEAPEDSSYYCRLLKKRTFGEDDLNEYTEDDRKIIEVYDAYIEQCTNEPEAFLDATDGITYYAKKNYWLILETIDHFIRIGYDGINFFKKDNVFLKSLDYMKPCVYTYEGEEHDEYIRTLFCGERLKNTYEKKGHYYAEFDSFSIEIIPYEDNEELPQIDRKDFSSYKNLYGCERFITKKCKCGGVGKLLLKFDYIYVVRCDKCKSATNIAFTANEAIESWESGNIPEDLSDIVIE